MAKKDRLALAPNKIEKLFYPIQAFHNAFHILCIHTPPHLHGQRKNKNMPVIHKYSFSRCHCLLHNPPLSTWQSNDRIHPLPTPFRLFWMWILKTSCPYVLPTFCHFNDRHFLHVPGSSRIRAIFCSPQKKCWRRFPRSVICFSGSFHSNNQKKLSSWKGWRRFQLSQLLGTQGRKNTPPVFGSFPPQK